jgi:hypothetical protein
LLRLVIGGVLLIHGLGHGGALGALIWIRLRPETETGGWTAARTWLASSLTADTAMLIARAFWIASLVGFVVAALSFCDVLVPGEVWKPLGVSSALVSMVGIVLFFGTWPMFNTLAALAVNIAVLVAVSVNWPPQSVFGT